jgi:hypothetical protein
MSVLRRLFVNSLGQDLLEYAMLTALVALLGMAAWAVIETRIGQAYVIYDSSTQDLWEPPDPGAGE